jgi:hypothetical protein
MVRAVPLEQGEVSVLDHGGEEADEVRVLVWFVVDRGDSRFYTGQGGKLLPGENSIGARVTSGRRDVTIRGMCT